MLNLVILGIFFFFCLFDSKGEYTVACDICLLSWPHQESQHNAAALKVVDERKYSPAAMCFEYTTYFLKSFFSFFF
jgi:hypothetical protein